MKNQIIKLVALVLFVSVTISSCAVEYRDGHGHPYDGHRNDNYHYGRY